MSGDNQQPPLWVSPDVGKHPIDDYRRHVNKKFGLSLENSHHLHQWSVTKPHDFWIDLYKYVGIVPPLPPHITRAYNDSVKLSDVPRFFEGVELNYTENVLEGKDPDAIALIGLREFDFLHGENVTWRELRERVRRVRSALIRNGLKQGDRVAAIMSTSVWAIVILLASASMGAIFSSISPDMGEAGCVTRLQQIEPAILFADSDMSYKGKTTSLDKKITSVVKKLPQTMKVFVIPITSQSTTSFPLVNEFLAKARSSDHLEYKRVPFSYPVYILYSSGTTGQPKCLVHQHGVVIQLKKVGLLHYSLGPKEVVFQYSSTSWVLFNIMNGHLSVGATVIAYDGSPLWPDATTMLKIIEKFRVTYFGTSPRYLLELEASKIVPRDEYDLSSLRLVTTTGATLTADQFRWFYQAFPQIHLSSVAGGTDIVTSWISCDPSSPVYAGEMQMIALGMNVYVADANSGEDITRTGKSGELVCPTPFPSMPVFLWGDKNNKKYKSSYFERFDNICVWAQHDWISVNPATQGITMHGRSDGVLNPSGIRFGSSEIYNISEGPAFNSEIQDTLCVGRRRKQDKDEIVFLFVKMRSNQPFTTGLEQRLRSAIRTGLSPRHVPKFILEVPEIPVTINGKKVETPVKRIISGDQVQVSSTVANPMSLEFFEQFSKLEIQSRAKL
ncbi:acetoacetate-CoA ligase [Coccidioides immitis RS]|uniref:Acetoacetate-CoA ligase n=3 Tax=Coccidioides immitis TaxID=5501 RepID=A0A0D8JX25_COCIM|nr:acetoacetate-CoA ligase [Coccidioides immitis RS]KJF61491.1 acetoacetate-CoA ligase [Coccidioides immitis RS]KMP07560.1 SUR5 protein [Coccidioides immitis RMSCC 2394]KMU71990.1 acetoacetyl-CoA synthetase [Coccidioides immitis RMSCC 3703]